MSKDAIRFDQGGHAFVRYHPCCFDCDRTTPDGKFLVAMYARPPKKEICCFCGVETRENNYRTFDGAEEKCQKTQAS